MDFDTIRYEVADGLCRLTLDRPDHMNAMTNRMVREAYDALAAAAADPSIRVLVLTGAGRAFCPGADLNHFTSGAARRGPHRPRVRGDDAAPRDARGHRRRHQRRVRRRRHGVGAGLRPAGDDGLGEVEHRLPRRRRRRRHGHPVVAATHRRSGPGARPVVHPPSHRGRRGGAHRARGSGVRRRRRSATTPRPSSRRCWRSRRRRSSG